MLALDPQRNALEGRATGGFVVSGLSGSGELESWPRRPSSNAVVHALLSGHFASTVTARPPFFIYFLIYFVLREDAIQFVRTEGRGILCQFILSEGRVFSVNSFVQKTGVFSADSLVQRTGVFSVKSFGQRPGVFFLNSAVQRAGVFSGCSFVQRAGVFSGCSFVQRAGVFSGCSFVQRAGVFSGCSFVQRAGVFSGCSFVQRIGVFSVNSYRGQGRSLAVRTEGRGVLWLFVQRAGVFSGCSSTGASLPCHTTWREPKRQLRCSNGQWNRVLSVGMASGTE